MFRAADKFNAREQADSTGQEHSESPEPKAPLRAGAASGGVPAGKLPAAALVVDVVEQAALRDQQRVRLEWTFCRQIRCCRVFGNRC